MEIIEAIELEDKKHIGSNFVREEQHLDWVANIIPIPIKNVKIWICIDFHDLSVVYPKNEFSLSILGA